MEINNISYMVIYESYGHFPSCVCVCVCVCVKASTFTDNLKVDNIEKNNIRKK